MNKIISKNTTNIPYYKILKTNLIIRNNTKALPVINPILTQLIHKI